MREKAGLPTEEALGVEGVLQPQVFVIQVMPELVEQGAQEGPEGYHPLMAGGAHPELDPRRAPRIGSV